MENLKPSRAEKSAAAAKRWNLKNPGYFRELHLIKKYHLTLRDFNGMLAEQGGVCAICRCPSDRWDVDHCHETGKVRSILCHGCNAAIGFLKESPKTALAAAEYLTKHGKL